MDDLLLVSQMHAPRDGRHDACRLTRQERAASEPARERFTFDVLHDEERPALMLADFEHRDDVRMDEPSGGGRLGAKPSAIRIRRECPVQYNL